MNILLLGSGGREHALAQKLAAGSLCSRLFIAPGNGGTAQFGSNVNLNITDFPAIDQFCRKENVTLIVVGPEEPLIKGIYDFFHGSTIRVFGPSANGAMLEGSKAFAKEFMHRHGIPTADYYEVTEHNLMHALEKMEHAEGPFVLKADGPAAGKGVLIIDDKEEAKLALRHMIEGKQFGASSERVVVEQFLDGIEFSAFVITDGHSYQLLPNAKDYKRIGEGDSGLNTGGMGAISPVPFVDEALMMKVTELIIQPSIAGLAQDFITYFGFLYFGLIIVDGSPFVIEYNCRLGDPETEVILPRLNNDLTELIEATLDGRLNTMQVSEDPRSAATVVIASGGYPGEFEKGKEITLPDINKHKDSFIYHAGTKEENGRLLSTGGRVMMVTSFGKNCTEACATSTQLCAEVHFDYNYFRKDIRYEFR